MVSTGKATLYTNPDRTCPYAARVRIVLEEKNIPYDIESIDLKNRPAKFNELYASINPIPGVSSKIPVFVDADGTTLTESVVILNYLEDKYPQHPQLPKDAAGKAKARLFIELLPQTFPAHLYGYMGADPGPEREKQRELFLNSLDAFEALLKNAKLDDGDFILGKQFSIADAQVAPFFNTVKVLFGEFRDLNILATARERKLEHTLRWAEAVYKRDTVTRSLCADEDLVALVGHHPYFKA